MRKVGFTAADIAAKEAKTDPAVKIGGAVIDDINGIGEKNGGENAAPTEKPKGGRPKKPKEKSEAAPPDEEPVTDENGEADEADSNG